MESKKEIQKEKGELKRELPAEFKMLVKGKRWETFTLIFKILFQIMINFTCHTKQTQVLTAIDLSMHFVCRKRHSLCLFSAKLHWYNQLKGTGKQLLKKVFFQVMMSAQLITLLGSTQSWSQVTQENITLVKFNILRQQT